MRRSARLGQGKLAEAQAVASEAIEFAQQTAAKADDRVAEVQRVLEAVKAGAAATVEQAQAGAALAAGRAAAAAVRAASQISCPCRWAVPAPSCRHSSPLSAASAMQREECRAEMHRWKARVAERSHVLRLLRQAFASLAAATRAGRRAAVAEALQLSREQAASGTEVAIDAFKRCPVYTHPHPSVMSSSSPSSSSCFTHGPLLCWGGGRELSPSLPPPWPPQELLAHARLFSL